MFRCTKCKRLLGVDLKDDGRVRWGLCAACRGEPDVKLRGGSGRIASGRDVELDAFLLDDYSDWIRSR